jgi:uncharacterized membrane protein YkvA (DUF1232 family)
LIDKIRKWARRLKRDVIAIWLAARDPRTPLLARCLALAVAGYALSPIDLIPDFIPVLGYLDDLLLVPLGILLVVRMIPTDLVQEFRMVALAILERPRSLLGATIILLIWAGFLAWITASWWT